MSESTESTTPFNAAAVRNFYLGLSMLVCAIATGLHSAGALAADASLQQVYSAANAGNYAAAQGMMDQVLRDHPNSAKAHFVEAELLAKQGQLSRADAELHSAERLDPALAFAKPAAVQELKQLLAAPAQLHARALQPAASHGMPWGLLVTVLCLGAAIAFFLRSRRQAQTYIPAGGSAYGAAPYGAAPPYAPYGGMGGMGAGAPGMGSTILGGLATGAAVGAGMVAGEALMHRMLDGGSASTANPGGYLPSDGVDNALADDERRYDMGGNDFGVNDTSSWDDGGGTDFGGGGDDWN